MRINFSAVGFIEFLCYLMIAGFFIRYLETVFHDRPLGKALAFIF